MTSVLMPGRGLLLVAGMPGAGKSTLLAALPPRPDVMVLDSDAFRAALSVLPLPYPVLRPLVHLLHRLVVIRAAFSSMPVVVVHLPATAPATRAAVARLAAASRREAHLLWLDVDAAEAREGQHRRGRVVPRSSFGGHAARAAATTAELRRDRPAGFSGVTVLDREAARAGLGLHTGSGHVPAQQRVPAPSK